jgi:hypothetical protein
VGGVRATAMYPKGGTMRTMMEDGAMMVGLAILAMAAVRTTLGMKIKGVMVPVMIHLTILKVLGGHRVALEGDGACQGIPGVGGMTVEVDDDHQKLRRSKPFTG